MAHFSADAEGLPVWRSGFFVRPGAAVPKNGQAAQQSSSLSAHRDVKSFSVKTSLTLDSA
jgi:hypothetical protein